MVETSSESVTMARQTFMRATFMKKPQGKALHIANEGHFYGKV
jgi:hypothetical protein